MKQKFSVICVSETWTDVHTEQLISIPGYDCICRSRTTGRGGGLALYIDTDLNVVVKNRPDLDGPDSSIYESLIVQLSPAHGLTKDIIVGVIYKPPNTNVESFVSNFSRILDRLNKENRPSYLLGDYNIDLLKYNNHSESFLNQLLSYGFFPKIDRPTRITDSTETLIDNILTNVHQKNVSSGIWTVAISDHLPVFITLPCLIPMRKKSDVVYEQKRIYSTQNFGNFRNKLTDITWSEVHDTPDCNDKYNCFIKIINELHDQCFSLTTYKINPLKDSKPWISPTILNSVKKKNTMYKHYLKSKSPALLEAYKKYKNKLTSILRQAEKNYFADKLSEAKDNMARTWKLINKMTNKSGGKQSIDVLRIADMVVK